MTNALPVGILLLLPMSAEAAEWSAGGSAMVASGGSAMESAEDSTKSVVESSADDSVESSMESSAESSTDSSTDSSMESSTDSSTEASDPSTMPIPPRTDVPVDRPRRRRRAFKDWIYRWAPERNMAELGAYGGAYQTGGNHELFEPDDSLPDQGFQTYSPVAGELGARLGFYPSRYFGFEVEGGAMPTETSGFERATLWHMRGSVVGQVGRWSLTPFALVGAGALGVRSSRAAVGNDVDPSVHFGGGVKAYLSRRAQVRLDLRDVVSHQQGVDRGFRNHGFEALVGVSVTLGRETHEIGSVCAVSDSDGDGLLDIEDQCVHEYGEDPYGCPMRDSDGDGFLDHNDACVDEPGLIPDGCPIRDSDADGVADPVDQCIETPENANGFEDADGCPEQLPQELADLDGVMEGIRFQMEKAIILARSRPWLDRMVELMQRYPDIRVEISGHTDDRGGHEYNVGLSLRRANAVRDYMVSHGVDADRIQTRGVGPTEPIANNNTERGRARNRRIELRVLITPNVE